MIRHYSIFLFALSTLLFVPAMAFVPGDMNQLDERGQRQGYWIITGMMTGDPGYASGEKVEEGHYKDNRKEGLWKKYWPGGKIRSEITYSSDKPAGAYVLYYPTGITEESGTWLDGRNTGLFRRYFPNGNPHQEFLFNSTGKRDGWQLYYHDNGELAMEVQIANGVENGVSRRFSSDGALVEEKIFEKGAVKPGSIKVFKNQPASPVIPKSDPYDTQFGKESTPTRDVPNRADTFRPNGHNVLYNQSGSITQIGDFRNGRLYNGKWHRYNDNGVLIRIEIYKSGRYIGHGVEPETP